MEQILDAIANLTVEIGKKKFKSQINETKLRKNINNYLEHQKKYNQICSLKEEIDFQGLIEYIQNNLLDDISVRVFSLDPKERENTRKTIIEMAIYYSKADTKESRSRVEKIVCNTLDIIKDFYQNNLSRKDLILIDGVKETIEDAHKETNIKIDAITNDIIHKSYSLDTVYNMSKNGEINEIQKLINVTTNVMSNNHPLSPYYGYIIDKNNIKSIPLNEKATKLYPPSFKCKGFFKMNGEFLKNMDKNVLNYANRHQKQITGKIIEAKKYLGDYLDPNQSEAQEIVDACFVIKPMEFPPAFPCSIKFDNTILYEYIELRIVEILDDGRCVFSNKEQQNCNLKIEIKVDIINTHGKLDFSIHIEKPNNKDFLTFAKMMKKSQEGSDMTIYMLREKENFISGHISSFEYKTGFESIDKEIDFLQRICEIEDYTKKSIKIPEQILKSDISDVKCISELIRGNEVSCKWNEVSINSIVDDNLRKSVKNVNNVYPELTLVSTYTVKIFNLEFELPLVQLLKSGKIKDLERLKKKLEYSDNGEDIKIVLVAGDDNTLITTVKATA